MGKSGTCAKSCSAAYILRHKFTIVIIAIQEVPWTALKASTPIWRETSRRSPSEDDFGIEPSAGTPRALAGALYRMARTRSSTRAAQSHHWFGGDGMIHGFYVAGARSLPQSLCPHARVRAGAEHGARVFGAMGTRALRSADRQSRAAWGTPTSSAAGKLLALEEGHQALPSSIPASSSGVCPATTRAGSPRTQIDPETGEMIWFGYPSRGPLRQDRFRRRGRRQVIRRDDFEAPSPPWSTTSVTQTMCPGPAAHRRWSGPCAAGRPSPGSRTKGATSRSCAATPTSTRSAGSTPRPTTSSTR